MKIAITMGDPAGIGPEVILKCLPEFKNRSIGVIGARGIFERLSRRLGLDFDFNRYLIDLIPDFDFEFGTVQKNCGKAAFEALRIGINLLKKKEIAGLVTAPISKEALWRSGHRLPGHTEILAREFKVKNYAMLAYSEQLKVAFLTTHTPLRLVSGLITPGKVFDKIKLLDDFLNRFMKIENPLIAVLAFNPHSFEFSQGEEEKIERAVANARQYGLNVEGPFPADSIGSLISRFQGVIAMYHDQGMILVKVLSQGRGVNVTLGLPFIRTSPLHGTAFDIAGKGIASSLSMETAIRLALQWVELSPGSD